MTERERLIHLLCNVDCNGADRREGGCSFRQDSRCNVIQKLDMCMVETIVDRLLANGVIVLDTDHVDVVKNREPLRTAFNMPLDELAELIRAKQEGRLIVPLFTLGQTVYNIEYGIKHVLIGEVYEIVSNEFGIIYRASRKGYYGFSFTAHAIGKTVFLTSEDAERALSKRSKT